MSPYINDTIAGYNHFLKEQRSPDAKITLALFDHSMSYVFQNRPSNVVYDLTSSEYTIGGSTALMDAFGQVMNDTDQYLKGFDPANRPSVIFVVMTDGEENASRKFTKEQIKTMVEARTEAGWVFTFLGANIDTFAAASNYGIGMAQTASYDQSTSTAQAFTATSDLVGRYRSAMVAGASVESMKSMGYTDIERTKMKGGK
jgi:hypothetical protein